MNLLIIYDGTMTVPRQKSEENSMCYAERALMLKVLINMPSNNQSLKLEADFGII